MWSTKQFRGKHHPGKLFDGFHALVCCLQIRPASHNAMILEQDRIVVVDKRFKPRAEFPSAGCPIRSQRNFAEANDDFRKHWFFKGPASGGESRRGWRVGMADGSHIGP